MCIWPQQVWAAGKSTVQPRRSNTVTVARPTSGNSVSARQVTNSDTLTRDLLVPDSAVAGGPLGTTLRPHGPVMPPGSILPPGQDDDERIQDGQRDQARRRVHDDLVELEADERDQ